MKFKSARCIWYISKYVAPPGRASSGGRGYLIMRELGRMGHNCVVVTSDSNSLAAVPKLSSPLLIEQADGMTVCWLRTLKYTVAKSPRRILSWLHFEWRLGRISRDLLPRPDVVIVSSLSLLTILNGFRLRRIYGCRLILEIRDIWPLTITEEGGFSRWNPLVILLQGIEWLGYRYADEIVGTMPNLGEHVAQVLGYRRATHCIPMGVDELSLSTNEDLPEEYAESHFPAGKFIVAHAGTIGITNALETFLLCAERMERRTEIYFVIVGEGDLRPLYEDRFGHLTNLGFAPKVKKSQVQAVLARCDLLYFSVHRSAVWRYGQSLNKVVDYMLAGKPIVASYTGYRSMIDEAMCGSYVEAGDVDALYSEILRIAELTAEERHAMGTAGRAWLLKNRTYSSLAKGYLPILFPDSNDLGSS